MNKIFFKKCEGCGDAINFCDKYRKWADDVYTCAKCSGIDKTTPIVSTYRQKRFIGQFSKLCAKYNAQFICDINITIMVDGITTYNGSLSNPVPQLNSL